MKVISKDELLKFCDRLEKHKECPIEDLVKTQAVKTERHAEDAIIIFFTTTGSLAFIAVAIIIDCIF